MKNDKDEIRFFLISKIETKKNALIVIKVNFRSMKKRKIKRKD